MKKLIILHIIVLLFLIVLTISIKAETETINSGVTFATPSIALDSNGFAHVSVEDWTNRDLEYCNNTAGSWSCIEIETGGNVGTWSSIAIDSNDKVHIAYQNSSGSNLRYCNNTGGAWNCDNVEIGGDAYGGHIALALDSNDYAHISHKALADNLRYCNNTAGSWSCVGIDAPGNIGSYSSIAIDSNDKVHISYFDDSADDLKYCNNTIGNWTCDTVATTGSVGHYSSIVLDSNDNVHISYKGGSDGLYYCNNTAGVGNWNCLGVDTHATDNSGRYSSIVIDSNNKVHMTHLGNTNSQLRYCNNTIGNWTCNDLESASDLGEPSGRWLAIKKGNIADSTSFSSSIHMSWGNSTDLLYTIYFIDRPISIDNCSTNTIRTLNISFIDFTTGNPLSVDYKYSVDYVNGTDEYNYSNSGIGSNITLCISSGYNLTSDIFIEYTNGSVLQTHYVDDMILTSTTQVITLRVIATTTDVTGIVYDQTNNLFEGVYIRYLKWDVDTNNYILMGIAKTNFEGETIMPLILNTELYKFMLYYPYSTLRQTTVPSYIRDTSILFQISTGEDVATDFHRTMNIDTRLTFSNITNRFTWTYSDTNSVITKACLDVFRPTAKGFNQSISHDCLSTVSGVITGDVTRENGTTFCANAEVTLSGKDWFIDGLCYTYPSKDSNPAQFMGLLIAFIMTIAFAFAFKYSVELGIIAIPLPLLFCSIMGIVDIATPIVVGIEIAAIVLAIILNRVID